MLTRLDSFTRKHVILMEPYTSSFIPRPPTWPGMRLTHLLGNLQVDAGYLKHCAFHRNYVQQGKTHTNCMTWRFRNKARHICMCPPLKNEMRMMFKRNCNLWYKAASREVPCFKHTQLVALFPPSFTSSLQHEKKWDWGCFLFLSWACR